MTKRLLSSVCLSPLYLATRSPLATRTLFHRRIYTVPFGLITNDEFALHLHTKHLAQSSVYHAERRHHSTCNEVGSKYNQIGIICGHQTYCFFAAFSE